MRECPHSADDRIVRRLTSSPRPLQKPLHPLRPRPSRHLARPRPRPRHQQRQRKPVVALVLQPARGQRDLGHRHRRHAFLRRARRKARPARSRDTRGTPAAARDGSSSSRPRGTGRARRARSRPPRVRGRCARRAPSRPAASIAASAAAKRACSVSRRSAGIASTSCSSRSPSVRDTGTSWRQQAPQPLRQEIALPALGRVDHRVHQPLQGRHDLGRGHRRGRHGDRMGDPEIADGEPQSGGGMGRNRPCSGGSPLWTSRRRTLQGPHAKRQRHPPHIPRILPQKRPRGRGRRARSCRATTRP